MDDDFLDDELDAQPVKKKGKGRFIKIVLALVLVGAGGGAAYAYLNPGVIPGQAKSKDENLPQFVLKGEEDPYAPATEPGQEAVAEEIDGEGGSKYRTSYYVFKDDFTSNLKNSVGLIQVSLAASTHRDGRVLMRLKKHELACRSGMLGVLADTPEEEVLTIDGKERLQKRLTDAINKVLTDEEGFGGVDNVYFRSLLIQ